MPGYPFAFSIVKKLKEAGHIAYFAGGWVRDYLMKHPSDDIDIATSASAAQIQTLFPKTIPVGIAFGILIVVEEGHHFEVATFRKESGYLDGRRPTTIELATPEEDAERRDFTINGMFWDPVEQKLYDYVGGKRDLKEGVIKAIGNPHERFLEDRLRMIRAVRYATRFHFPIEPTTAQAILEHSHSLFPAVAIERVWQEFKKMSQFSQFDRALLDLHKLNLLPTIFPQLKEIPSIDIEKRLAPLASYPKNSPTIVQLLELFPQSSLQETLKLCDYLKLSREDREIACFFLQGKAMLQMPQKWQDNLEKVEWAYFYANPHSADCIEIAAAHLPLQEREFFKETHRKRIQTLEKSIFRIQSNHPIIRADHLLKEGIAPGKKMGLLLKGAEKISIDQNIEDPQTIIQFLKNSTLWNT